MMLHDGAALKGLSGHRVSIDADERCRFWGQKWTSLAQ